jgi:hypothetical protein
MDLNVKVCFGSISLTWNGNPQLLDVDTDETAPECPIHLELLANQTQCRLYLPIPYEPSHVHLPLQLFNVAKLHGVSFSLYYGQRLDQQRYELIIYGPIESASEVGNLLDKAKLYLQIPTWLESQIQYLNPHQFTQDENGMSSCLGMEGDWTSYGEKCIHSAQKPPYSYSLVLRKVALHFDMRQNGAGKI